MVKHFAEDGLPARAMEKCSLPTRPHKGIPAGHLRAVVRVKAPYLEISGVIQQ